MKTTIPSQEFKAVIKSLNRFLKQDGHEKIRVVRVAKKQVLDDFINTVLDFIENDKAEELPGDVIDCWNEYVGDDDPVCSSLQPLYKQALTRQSAKKPSKQELYEQRLKDDAHKEELFVETGYFSTKNQLTELRDTVKEFNIIVERDTGGNEHSVILRYGITKIAADFDYQYKKFQKFVRENGLFVPDIQEELEETGAIALKKSITWKNATGNFTMRKNIFKETDLKPTELCLLMLYKAYCNTPSKEYNYS